MENTSSPQQAGGDAIPVVAPIVAPVAPSVPDVAPQKLEEGGDLQSKFYGIKVDYIILFTLSMVIAAHGIAIMYFRKGLKTNNSIQNLQNQLRNTCLLIM